MDDLAKLILSDLRTCIREYGGEFTEKQVFISINRGYKNDDPWLVTYIVGDSYSGTGTKGADLSATITEYMRRKGWTEANKPMVLIESQPAELTSDE